MKTIIKTYSPQDIELILSGKKTIFVMKTEIEPPFKVVMYENLGKDRYCSTCKDVDCFGRRNGARCHSGCGKCVAEFVCNSVAHLEILGTTPYKYFTQGTCLTQKELADYANGSFLYGYHITALRIYDKPRELSEFRATDIEAVKRCELRERIYTNPVYTNGALLKGSYLCRDKNNWCEKCHTKPVTRAPQSFCYIQDPEV